MPRTNEKKRSLFVESLESRRLLTIDLGNILPFGNSITLSHEVAANHNEKLFGYQYELFTKMVDRQFKAQFVGSFDTFFNNHVNDGEICGTDEEGEDVLCSTGNAIDQETVNPETGEINETIDYPTFPPHNGHDYENWGGHKQLADGGATVAQILSHMVDDPKPDWPQTEWSFTHGHRIK